MGICIKYMTETFQEMLRWC